MSILSTAFVVPLAVGLHFPVAPIQMILIELLLDLASPTIIVLTMPNLG